MFKKLYLLFQYNNELEELEKILEIIRKEKRAEKLLLEFENKKDNLKLCFKHKQEQNHSIYSEDNCDYCKALKRIAELEKK